LDGPLALKRPARLLAAASAIAPILQKRAGRARRAGSAGKQLMTYYRTHKQPPFGRVRPRRRTTCADGVEKSGAGVAGALLRPRSYFLAFS
jgi:hypothetical protein